MHNLFRLVQIAVVFSTFVCESNRNSPHVVPRRGESSQ